MTKETQLESLGEQVRKLREVLIDSLPKLCSCELSDSAIGICDLCLLLDKPKSHYEKLSEAKDAVIKVSEKAVNLLRQVDLADQPEAQMRSEEILTAYDSLLKEENKNG